MENKEGFIRIVEAATMVLIILGIVLIGLSDSSTNKGKDTSEIDAMQQSVLREAQLNDSIREDIIASNLNEEFDVSGIINGRLNNFECKAKVCALNNECLISNIGEGEVYIQETIISSDLSSYNPRKLKLFCWRK